MCTNCPQYTYSIGYTQKECVNCPESFECPGGIDYLVLKPGYWRVNHSTVEYYQCVRNEAVCLGDGQCAHGNAGVKCEECDGALGFEKFSAFSVCRECDASVRTLVLKIVFANLGLVLVVFYWSALIERQRSGLIVQKVLARAFGVFAKIDHQELIAFEILLNFVQILVISTQIQSALPQVLLSGLQSVLSPGYYSHDVACLANRLGHLDPLRPYWANLAIAIADLALILLIQAARNCLHRRRARNYEAVLLRRQQNRAKSEVKTFTLGTAKSASGAVQPNRGGYLVLVYLHLRLYAIGLLNQTLSLAFTKDLDGVSYAIQSYRIATSDPSYARLIAAHALLAGIYFFSQCSAYVVLARRERQSPHRHVLFGLYKLYFRNEVLEQEAFNFCAKILLVIANNILNSDQNLKENVYLLLIFVYLSWQQEFILSKLNRISLLLLFSKFVLAQNTFYSLFSDLNSFAIGSP